MGHLQHDALLDVVHAGPEPRPEEALAPLLVEHHLRTARGVGRVPHAAPRRRPARTAVGPQRQRTCRRSRDSSPGPRSAQALVPVQARPCPGSGPGHVLPCPAAALTAAAGGFGPVQTGRRRRAVPRRQRKATCTCGESRAAVARPSRARKVRRGNRAWAPRAVALAHGAGWAAGARGARNRDRGGWGHRGRGAGLVGLAGDVLEPGPPLLRSARTPSQHRRRSSQRGPVALRVGPSSPACRLPIGDAPIAQTKPPDSRRASFSAASRSWAGPDRGRWTRASRVRPNPVRATTGPLLRTGCGAEKETCGRKETGDGEATEPHGRSV